VNRKVSALLILALMASPGLAVFVGATSITVSTDREDYAPGEDVEIFGTSDPNASITILVNNTLGIIYNITISADEDGDYDTTVQLSSDAPEGSYNVTASTVDATAQASFTVTISISAEDETVEEAAERAVVFKVAIERAYAFLARVNATAERLKDEGYDVDQIKANLDEANVTLTQAGALLGLFDIDGADRKLATARGILGRTMGLLHSTAKKVKAVKTERFLEQVERRILSMNEKINRFRDGFTAGAVVSVTAALQNTKMKLERIRVRLIAGDVAEAIDELEDAVEEIDESVDELNGLGISKLIKSMNKLEAKIRVLNATAKKLGRRGKDTSEIEEEIQIAQNLLNEATALLEEGNTDAAKELLEEVQEQLDEALEANRKMIRSKTKNKIKNQEKKAKKPHPKKDKD